MEASACLVSRKTSRPEAPGILRSVMTRRYLRARTFCMAAVPSGASSSDRNGSVGVLGLAQDVETGSARHFKIGDDQKISARANLLYGGGPVRRFVYRSEWKRRRAWSRARRRDRKRPAF